MIYVEFSLCQQDFKLKKVRHAEVTAPSTIVVFFFTLLFRDVGCLLHMWRISLNNLKEGSDLRRAMVLPGALRLCIASCSVTVYISHKLLFSKDRVHRNKSKYITEHIFCRHMAAKRWRRCPQPRWRWGWWQRCSDMYASRQPCQIWQCYLQPWRTPWRRWRRRASPSSRHRPWRTWLCFLQSRWWWWQPWQERHPSDHPRRQLVKMEDSFPCTSACVEIHLFLDLLCRSNKTEVSSPPSNSSCDLGWLRNFFHF